MKITVDLTKCQNHGQCTYSAPEVFSLNDHGELMLSENVFSRRVEAATEEYMSIELDEAWRENIEEAIDMCPVQAIRDLGGD